MSSRECGKCSACCLVFDIDVLHKPAGEWCAHCVPGSGCSIYPKRPKPACTDFECAWKKGVGTDADRPEKSGILLRYSTWRPVGWILQIFEVEQGALSREWTRACVREALAEGRTVIEYQCGAAPALVTVPPRLNFLKRADIEPFAHPRDRPFELFWAS